MIDVTVADRAAIESTKDWSKEVAYKGALFFDAYIEAMGPAGRKLGIGKSHTFQVWDDEAGREYDEQATIDGQEVYFGYIKSRDLFVMGFDMWEHSSYSAVAYMKFDGERFNVLNTEEYGDLFYSRHTGLKHLREQFPDLLDIRLD
jgi:hypothetical protein